MRLRVKAYAPNGASLGVLPAPTTISASQVLGDTGAFSMEYAVAAPASSILTAPCELALEISADNGMTWSEPNDARFVFLRRKGDGVKQPSNYSVEAMAYSWRMGTAKVLPGGLLDINGNRAFSGASAGTIMATLINEAQTRGALSGITYDFTNALDSAGAAWNTTITIGYTPGMDYLTLMRNLFDQGMIDFRFNARKLSMYNANSVMARRLDAADPTVDLRYGRDLTDAPWSGTWEALANYAFVEGNAGVSLERTNISAVVPWGRQEAYITQGGVSDVGTMTTLADATLSLSADERVQRTFGLVLGASRWLPDLDYALGDYVGVGDLDSPLGNLVAYRVRQITLTQDASGVVGGNVVLNDRFVEADIRVTRRISGIVGGSTIAGGSGAIPVGPVPGVDTTVPAAVANLITSSAAYLDDQGLPHAQVTLTWSAVTLNTDASACNDLARYEVFSWPTTAPTQVSVSTADIAATAGSVTWTNSPYAVGASWSFKVRAVDTSGHFGAFSAVAVRVMAADSTPPAAPSTPTTTVRLGVVTMTWDGKDNTGAAMTLDTKRIDVHRSMVNAFTPDSTTLVGSLAKAGWLVFAGQDYNTTWYYRLVAVDTSGNASAPSAQGSAVTTPLVATDLVGSPIPGSAVAAGSITAAQIDNATNSAITTAQSTAASANTAAGAAQTQANTATTNAAAAQASATTATNNAATAQTQANTATTNAATADAKAVTATSNAATAQTQANTATTNAATAQTAANTASSAASTADAKAVTATNNAATAQTAANNANSAASTAQGTANTANTAASAAQTQANTATTNAANAQTTANSANTAAATAQTQANTATTNAAQASSDAAAASGLAGTKAVVLYQSTAPGSTYQNTNTLWIDTTGGANTPKKWASGTTWTTITDKAATDAATAAASAQGTANTATTNAATAQTQANTATTNAASAQTSANTANTAAGAAQTQANTATTNAATADAKAVTATNNAATAQGQATTATNNAATAQTQANTATTNAASAQSTANTANTAAGAAQTSANTATTNAATADAKAVTATTNAATAQTQATLGVNNAATAQTQANTATTNAAAAQTQANTATTNAASALAAATTAQSTADGKNKVLWSTLAASGTAYVTGDVWFQTSAGIIIGQWAFIAGAWAARTIDNAVIANLDAGKITAGYISALRIAANTITAAMIAANSITALQLAANAVTADSIAAGSVTAAALTGTAIDGKLITGATIRTASSGARFEVDTFGARLYDANGNLEVNLPSDPNTAAQFTGNVSATGLTVQDHLSLQGVNNDFAAQSVTTMQSGLMAPASPPSVVVSYQSITMQQDTDTVNNHVGLWATPGGGGVSRGWIHYDPYSTTDTTLKFQVQRFDWNGNLLSTTPVFRSGEDQQGVAEFGTTIISLVHTGGNDYFLYSFNSTSGGMQSAAGFTYPAGSHLPTIFTDASWVYVAYTTATQLIIERRAPDTLSLLGTWSGPNGGINRNLTSGVGLSNFDYGTAHFIITDDIVGAYGYAWTASGSTLTPVFTNDSWPLPNSVVPYGIAWDGTRFWVGSSSDNNLVKMSTNNWTTETNVWWAAYAWYHSTAFYQTPASLYAKFTMVKRAWITISTAAFPAGSPAPDSVMTYFGRNPTNPGLAGMWHPTGTPPTAGVSTYLYGNTIYTFSGANPVSVSTFPASVAGKMISSAKRIDGTTPKWTISGDGTVSIQDAVVVGFLTADQKMQHGSVTLISLVASTGATSGSVSFPLGAMAAVPAVTMTANSSRVTCSVSAITVNGFNWSCNNWTPGSATTPIVYWVAVC